MSWISVAWTRVKGTAENVASAVPIVGGALSSAIESIHTGDEHFDASTGKWVRNDTATPTTPDPTGSLKLAIEQTQQFNVDEMNRLRTELANLTAKAGVAAAAQVGPSGNIYQQGVSFATANPFLIVLTVLAVGAGVYIVLPRRKG